MSQSFSISSAKTHLSLAPGEVFNGELTITNLSDSPLIPVVTPAPFSVQDENYSLSFEDETDHTQALAWLSLVDVPPEILPGEQGTVTYSISVPETAPAGGQYFALLVSSASAASAPSSASSISIENVAKIADLFYLSVSGETTLKVDVLENSIKKFYLNSPISTSSLVKNSSNVHVPVSYSLSVFSLLDGVELYSTSSAKDSRTLLPDTKFFNESTWEDTPTLGIFKVRQEISYLSSSDLSETLVFVCPGWFLGLIVAFLFSILLAIFERMYRRKNNQKPSKNSKKALDLNKHKD